MAYNYVIRNQVVVQTNFRSINRVKKIIVKMIKAEGWIDEKNIFVCHCFWSGNIAC